MGRVNLWNYSSMPQSIIDDTWNITDNFDSWLAPTRSTEKDTLEYSACCDIRETKDEFFLSFDLPGVISDDVKIELTGNQLAISGERKLEKEYQEADTHRVERSYGKFSRAFTLSEEVDLKKIEADFDNGVLSIIIPKAEVKKPRQINIGSTKKGFLKKLSHKEAAQTAYS